MAFGRKADVRQQGRVGFSVFPAAGLHVEDLPAEGPPAGGRHVFLSEMTADYRRQDGLRQGGLRQEG